MYLTIGINIAEFSLNFASIYWNSTMFSKNTSKVLKELLIRCPETIQHICMSILVHNKTITFVWLIKVIKILGAKPKLIRSDNHSNNYRPKELGFGMVCKIQTLWV
jgi:hypothetical protein